MTKDSKRLLRASSRERLAVVLRESRELVTVEDAARALDTDRRRAAKMLARWTEQGWLKRIRRGVYTPIPLEALSADRSLEDPWVLVPELFAPGYVGGWSAADHWGLTEQIFNELCVFTARPVRHKRDEIGGARFVFFRIQPEVVFGTRAVWRGKVRVQVSDPSRTLVDLLARPSAGGHEMAHLMQQCVAAVRPLLEDLFHCTIEAVAVFGREVLRRHHDNRYRPLGFPLT